MMPKNAKGHSCWTDVFDKEKEKDKKYANSDIEIFQQAEPVQEPEPVQEEQEQEELAAYSEVPAL